MDRFKDYLSGLKYYLQLKLFFKKMIEKIPKIFIQNILKKTDIISLIKSKVNLKKIGKHYKTLCPFHYEKKPSFTVSKKKQFFYCFGCHVHGNAIDFIMLYEKINFINTIFELTKMHGLKIPSKKINIYNSKNLFDTEKIHKILKKTTEIYKSNLYKTPNIAYQYLKNRGINNKTMQKFDLGFAIAQKNQILNYFSNLKIKTNILIKCGLVNINKKIKKKYDQFKKRIIFPIKDKNGNINGFGGRALNNTTFPKYLNSPETTVFYKKKNLYGLYEIYKKNKNPKKILIVEGYLDVISLTQFQINYSTAILGTILTKFQIEILFQITNQIIFCYDGDIAGKEASWKTIKIILPFIKDHRIIKFIFLPLSEDPSSIISKEGKEKFEERIQKSENFYNFIFKKLSKGIEFNCTNDCIKFIYLIIPIINQIPGKIIKIYLLKKLCEKVKIENIQQLYTVINQKKIEKKKKIQKPKKITVMRLLISLLIQNPKLSKLIKNPKNIRNIKIQGILIFYDLIKLLKKNKNLKTGQILEYYRNSQLENIFRNLMIWDNMIEKKKIQSTFSELLIYLKIKNLEHKYEILIRKEKKSKISLSDKKKIWHINKKLSFIREYYIKKK